MRPRRSSIVAGAVVVALLVAAAAVVVVPTGDSDPAAPAGTEAVGLSLAEPPPYLGVSCPDPNEIACGRVGLAVALGDPVVRLEGTVGGVPIRLHDMRAQGARVSAGLHWRGFTQRRGFISRRLGVRPDRAGGRWFGNDAPKVPVRLTGYSADGRTLSVEFRVRLSAGYG